MTGLRHDDPQVALRAMPLPDVLRQLLTAAGPSGYETAPAAVFADAGRAFTDDVSTDVMGSVVARVPGTEEGSPLLAIVGHIDEIGLIVTHIDDNGFLRFIGVGGWDGQILTGQRVELLTKDGPLPGVCGRKAIHMLREDDRKKVVELRDMHIDIGASSGDEARERVRIGDVAVIAAEPVEVLNDRVVSRAMDNRLGAFIALEAARLVAEAGGAPGAVAACLAGDPILAPLVAARPGLRLPGAWDPFETGCRAILGQQVSVAAAIGLAGKLVAAFGTPLAEPSGGLTHVFPAPADLVEADVARALNMPRARGAAIRALAAAALADPDLFAPAESLEAALLRFTAIRGIGPWTAQYIAMRALKLPDALPVGDVGLLRALETGTGRPSPAELLARAEAWRPFRAYAAQHLWAADEAAVTGR